MIKIKKLDVLQPSPSFIQLTWYLEPTTETLSSYHVDVYQSELVSTNISDYRLLASGISPQSYNTYYDYSVSGLTNKFGTYTYIVDVVSNSLVLATRSDPVSITVTSDKYARAIIASRALILDKHSGQDYKILKRKTFGTYCSNCFDVTLQRTTKAKCLVCYSTTYTGGFYLPFNVRGQLNEAPKRSVLTTYGDWQDQDAILIINNKPILVAGDVVVDRLSRRWNVVTVRITNKALFIVSQQAQIRQIERDDIVYEFPVSW
jgi:hypothetical protein